MDKFYLFDIVVWNGVITTYGSIKNFVLEEDLIRKATFEEIEQYDKKQKEKS